ncbi:protein monoglycylase TTLL8 isoform X2 [Ambystoma mexicanum]|uniref:protein monoglycylase TTLL8 isoform X2 n=1 Tax=Ambystoma mexicanum TaxID=8296 RepID=UPI0037E701E8
MKRTYTRKKTCQTSPNEEEKSQEEYSPADFAALRGWTFSEPRVKQIMELPSFSKHDKFKQAKFLAETAIKEKKIFTIYGHYPIIRASLRKRGWAERKFPILQTDLLKTEQQVSDEAFFVDGKMQMNDGRDWTTKQLTGYYLTGEKKMQDEEDKSLEEEQEMSSPFQCSDSVHDIMSRLMRNEMPYFIWTVRRDVIDYHHLTKEQMLNHYGRTGCFTTKIGLCLNLRNLPWYAEANPDTFFPRCYNLCSEDEKNAFIEDFRHTAVCSILKWVVLQSSSRPTLKTTDDNRTDAEKTYCSPELINRAYSVCQNYLGKAKHEDIDLDVDLSPLPSELEWNDLLKQYYTLIHDGGNIDTSIDHIAQCQEILTRVQIVNPQLTIEGIRNVWIIKPGAKSRGRDIVCMDKVEDILRLLQADPSARRDHKWVVQKYIETPLLIYSTKFDIRQWFLVTDWNPLTVWFYKDCYLRFSTQHYTLEKLDSCIHLCNNSIQKHYKNCSERNPLLPKHNMWGSTKFRDYLENRGFGGMWESVIYPSMKNAITYTMKMAQDTVEARKNSFELYGADFIIGEDFKPWLIEINSSPTLFPSTPITAHLCAQVQEDLIKVVIDRQTDKSCNIGKFELLWKQPSVEIPPTNCTSLVIEGSEIKRPRTQPMLIPSMKMSGRLSSPVQPRAKQFLTSYEDQPTYISSSLNIKQTIPVKKERLLPYSVSAPAKCAQKKSSKPKHTPLESIDKSDHSGFPAFKPHQVLSIPKVKHKTTVSARLVKTETDHPPLTANAIDWTVLQPSKVSSLTKIPCLVCKGTYQMDRMCKNCSSFSATVLQGGSYKPAAPIQNVATNLLTPRSIITCNALKTGST